MSLSEHSSSPLSRRARAMHVLRASTAASASAASRPSPRTRSRAASRPPRPRGARPRDRRGREKEAIRRDAISLRAAAKNDAETRGGGGDDDAEDASIKPTNASGGGANDGAGEPTMADARRKFSETFWAGHREEPGRGSVACERGRRRTTRRAGDVPDDFATAAGEANAKEKKTKTKTTTTTTTTKTSSSSSAASSSATSDEEQGEKGDEGEAARNVLAAMHAPRPRDRRVDDHLGSLRSTHVPDARRGSSRTSARARGTRSSGGRSRVRSRDDSARRRCGWRRGGSRCEVAGGGAAAGGALSFVVPDVVAEMAAREVGRRVHRA